MRRPDAVSPAKAIKPRKERSVAAGTAPRWMSDTISRGRSFMGAGSYARRRRATIPASFDTVVPGRLLSAACLRSQLTGEPPDGERRVPGRDRAPRALRGDRPDGGGVPRELSAVVRDRAHRAHPPPRPFVRGAGAPGDPPRGVRGDAPLPRTRALRRPDPRRVLGRGGALARRHLRLPGLPGPGRGGARAARLRAHRPR